MYQHPLMTEMLAREQIAGCYVSAQREKVGQSMPLLSRLGALLAVLRTRAQRPARGLRPDTAGAGQV
jgi:hypothetical protein